MTCKKCNDTGIVELFSGDWPSNCKCEKGLDLEVERLKKENKKLKKKIKDNNILIANRGYVDKPIR